ncbi:uncharacterized protein TRIADDRAFT_59964 [Trichoplax adhaerens]|uniref:Arrestin C-terminal-like domain-containing protein n=1 Tax=Trichoplax adhaerens TaxID=10228 RepID=B3S6X5_TRIAD|nr:hypothetical protein TRIADDRAFT_59964 [Trichoplax adhaerens]EDV21468.1 hypothetical protein TRIADDRAFT_59964 [Trichoplax adhaerens]|eukprot:XP_002116068.1 hypothetical protein TRIADDRAFT_59964 [Trichoplax adhaerens]
MRKLILFQIILDQNKLIYNPGDSIHGQVLIEFREAIKLKFIKIRLFGCAYTHTKSKNRSVIEREVNDCYEFLTFCDRTNAIYGGERDGDGNYTWIPAGAHKFGFQFQLPIENLPSSFDYSSDCYIRYRLEATAERPKERKYETKVEITIKERININLPFLFRAKAPVKRQKNVGWLIWKRGPLKVTSWLNRYGYCPGDKIIINVEIENLTRRTIPYVKAKLLQDVRYVAEGTFEHHDRELAAVHYNRPITGGATMAWTNGEIIIPNLSPTIKCSIIELLYYIKISVKVPFGFNLCVNMPVVIGTMSLRSSSPTSCHNWSNSCISRRTSDASTSSSSCSSSWVSENSIDVENTISYLRSIFDSTRVNDVPAKNNLPPSYDTCVASNTTINDIARAENGDEMIPTYSSVINPSANRQSSSIPK